jgi:hypothetical protein
MTISASLLIGPLGLLVSAAGLSNTGAIIRPDSASLFAGTTASRIV